MAHYTYHIGQHDGGWAYRLGDVWSEPFPDHATALATAKKVALRQHVEGETAEIMYETADGEWKTEHIDRSEKPDVDVKDV